MAEEIVGVSYIVVKNTRRVMLTCNGETKPLPQWAREKGLNPSVIYQRVFFKKWTIEKALETPHAKVNRHKMSETNEYAIWCGMITRCTNKNMKAFKNYGGRGIKVCERWMTFTNFIEDMGPRPSLKHTLERIDNDRGYEPANVKWATRAEQSRNNRRNVILEFNGEKKILTDWAKAVELDVGVLWHRIFQCGWSVEKALTTPKKNLFGN